MTRYDTMGTDSSPVPPTTLFPIFINNLIPSNTSPLPSLLPLLGVFLTDGVQVAALRPHNTKFLPGKYIS